MSLWQHVVSVVTVYVKFFFRARLIFFDLILNDLNSASHSKLGQVFRFDWSIYTKKYTLLAKDRALDVLVSSNL